MPPSFALRHQIEAALANRFPSALTPAARVAPVVIPTGIPAVDELLRGGFPCATITELVGTECSGRTTMALASMAAITRSGGVCAWIDVADSLDPLVVAANGVDLERLLWVRCGPEQATSQAKQNPVQVRESTVVASTESPSRHTGGGSPHPRSEGRDMPEAIGALLNAHGGLYDKQLRREKRSLGTPGAPNRLLTRSSEDREEQVNSDRLPPRRGENLSLAPRCAEPQPRRSAQLPSGRRLPFEPSERLKTGMSAPGRSLQALDQALRTTDLLLQGGGFSAIVLDLGSVAPDLAWRIPLATWFRFRTACERTRVSLLLLTQHPCARSSAELVVRMQTGSMEAQSKVMTGVAYHAAIERNRSQESGPRVVPIRKPPVSERPGQWKSEASWAQAK